MEIVRGVGGGGGGAGRVGGVRFSLSRVGIEDESGVADEEGGINGAGRVGGAIINSLSKSEIDDLGHSMSPLDLFSKYSFTDC